MGQKLMFLHHTQSTKRIILIISLLSNITIGILNKQLDTTIKLRYTNLKEEINVWLFTCDMVGLSEKPKRKKAEKLCQTMKE